MTKEHLEALREAVVRGRVTEVGALAQAALNADLLPEEILQSALLPAMVEVGRRFECEEFFVPEMMASAKGMQTALKVLRPLLVRSGVKPVAKAALGTVEGDLHDIGKNLVGLMLEGGGFEVVDLGANVDPERFVAAVQDGAELIGLSALLTTTMTNMPRVLQRLQETGVRSRTKVIIGGAPVSQAFAEEIGADGYAPDASRAVGLAKALMGLD